MCCAMLTCDYFLMFGLFQRGGFNSTSRLTFSEQLTAFWLFNTIFFQVLTMCIHYQARNCVEDRSCSDAFALCIVLCMHAHTGGEIRLVPVANITLNLSEFTANIDFMEGHTMESVFPG